MASEADSISARDEAFQKWRAWSGVVAGSNIEVITKHAWTTAWSVQQEKIDRLEADLENALADLRAT